MQYIAVLNDNEVFAERLFSVILELEETPVEEDQEAAIFLKNAKSLLRRLLLATTIKKEHDHELSYYELYDIKYYQNGLCTLNEEYINLGSFAVGGFTVGRDCFSKDRSGSNDKNIHATAQEILHFADSIKDRYPIVFYQLCTFADPMYKISRLYNGVYDSLEQIVERCKTLQSSTRNKKAFKQKQSIAEEIIKHLQSEGLYVWIEYEDIDKYVHNNQEQVLKKVNVSTDSFITAAEQLLQIMKSNDNLQDIARRLRLI